MTLTPIDIVFVILLILVVLRSMFRGFVHEFMSMAAIILGILAAVLLSGIVAVKISPYVGNSYWTQIIAFLGLFLLVYVMVKLFEGGLNRVVERINFEQPGPSPRFFPWSGRGTRSDLYRDSGNEGAAVFRSSCRNQSEPVREGASSVDALRESCASVGLVMFENIIGQSQVVEQLQHDTQQAELPSAILLHGPQYSGKLSIALELARVLTCEKGSAEWNCTCKTCAAQRQLVHPETLLLGGRYFLQDILACGEALRQNRRPAAQYLYVRSLRKLLRRFDSVLWEGDETRLAKSSDPLTLLAETAEELTPVRDDAPIPGPTTLPRALPSETRLEKLLSKALAAAEKVCTQLVTDNVPVGMIRRATFWAHMTTQSRRKVIIIENADGMQAGSRNALLKVLEEPPAGVYFVLTTTRRGAIIPTILSRTRSYATRDRGLDDTQQVLDRIFRLPSEGCATMRDFFLRMEFAGTADIRLQAHAFLEAVLAAAPDPSVVVAVQAAMKAASTRSAFRYFADELLRRSQAELRTLPPGSRLAGIGRLERWGRILEEHVARVEQLNMSGESAIEMLYYEMRRPG